MRRRAEGRLGLAAVFALCVASCLGTATAAEGPTVYLWGAQRGAERMPEVAQAIEDGLKRRGDAVERVKVPSAGCEGPACLAALRGQPGLVGWFGELLTEKYNRTPEAPITLAQWDNAYDSACFVEPNNTILNLLKKARDERYRGHVVELFKTSNLPFSFDDDVCNYLYLNGILTYEEIPGKGGRPLRVCRFSSPFIQHRLYNGFSRDMAALGVPVPPVDPQIGRAHV